MYNLWPICEHTWTWKFFICFPRINWSKNHFICSHYNYIIWIIYENSWTYMFFHVFVPIKVCVQELFTCVHAVNMSGTYMFQNLEPCSIKYNSWTRNRFRNLEQETRSVHHGTHIYGPWTCSFWLVQNSNLDGTVIGTCHSVCCSRHELLSVPVSMSILVLDFNFNQTLILILFWNLIWAQLLSVTMYSPQ